MFPAEEWVKVLQVARLQRIAHLRAQPECHEREHGNKVWGLREPLPRSQR